MLAFAAVVLLAANPQPAQASHLCGNTGSSQGPFDLETYEASDWRTKYARTMELAGFNRLFPDVSGFDLPQLETGSRSAGSGQLTDPYIPPTLLKAIAWIESSWAQADYSVPYGAVGPVLVSHACAYGIAQVLSGMQNTTNVPTLDQAMIGGHYAFNIARGARILAEKWNAAPTFRPLVGDRDPKTVEDWYYAVWSYHGFAFKNHPLNPDYPLPRPAYRCDGTQSRSNYPYQELVFGCMANPPVVAGVALWNPLAVTLPNLSQPAFSLGSWTACSISQDCAAMDLVTPNPSHTDPANTSLSRIQVIGSPVLSVSTDNSMLLAPPGGESLPLQLTVANTGSGALSWRATASAPWLEISSYQGVSRGADLGLRTSSLVANADASGLTDGTYTAKIKFESLYAGNSPHEVSVTFQVGELCSPFLDLLSRSGACSGIQALYDAGITGGCTANPLMYCPNASTNRAEMAAFILKAMRHHGHLPDYQGYFSDVGEGRWYTGYAEHLREHDITSGFPDGTYRPDSALTRAEAAVFIVRALDETPVDPPTGTVFSDVPASHWAAGYVERLAKRGITGGYPDGTYRPEKALSRAEAAIFVARAWSLPYVTRGEAAFFTLTAMGHDGHLPPYQGFFSDVPAGQWYTGYVEHIREHGFTAGYPDGTYRPSKEQSRAGVAVFIIRALGETPVESPSGLVFSDVPASHWAAGYIERLAQLGVTVGYADGTYRPENGLRRTESDALIAQAWGLPAP